MKNNLIHFFAVIGFGTFILLACSVDEIADSMNNNNNYGKYQITATSYNGKYIYGLNTETGEVVRVSDPNNHTFTH